MRRLVSLLVVLTSLVLSGNALAAEVVLPDREGRSITFDVRAEGVDAEWYAELLRAAPHGDEISTVRIQIVSWDEIGRQPACRGRRLLRAAVCPGRERRTYRAHAAARVRAPPRPHARRRRRARNRTGCPSGGAPAAWPSSCGSAAPSGLRARVGPIHRRDLRRGLRAPRARRDELQDRLARPTRRDRDRGAAGEDLGLGPPPAVVRPPVLKPVTITRSGTLAPRDVAVRSASSVPAGASRPPSPSQEQPKRARARLEVLRQRRRRRPLADERTREGHRGRPQPRPGSCTATSSARAPRAAASAERAAGDRRPTA